MISRGISCISLYPLDAVQVVLHHAVAALAEVFPQGLFHALIDVSSVIWLLAAYGVSFRNAPRSTMPCMRICRSASEAISRAILTMSQK